jgi:hypothetical protein
MNNLTKTSVVCRVTAFRKVFILWIKSTLNRRAINILIQRLHCYIFCTIGIFFQTNLPIVASAPWSEVQKYKKIEMSLR